MTYTRGIDLHLDVDMREELKMVGEEDEEEAEAEEEEEGEDRRGKGRL